MPKKPPTPPVDEQEPPSETVRLAGDLMEMIREICFRRRDERKRRLKITQYLDNLLRPIVTREYEALKEEEKED